MYAMEKLHYINRDRGNTLINIFQNDNPITLAVFEVFQLTKNVDELIENIFFI